MNSFISSTKHLHCPLSIKNISEQGVFSGYASIFNVVDSHYDAVMPGAFSHTLQQQKEGGSIKLLWQHRADEPIGVFRKVREDARGLYVEAQLSLEVQRAREAYSLLKSGAIEGMSIGYNALDYTIDETTGIRQLIQVDLWEISLVTFPANQDAQVTMVKDYFAKDAVSTLEKALNRAISIIR